VYSYEHPHPAVTTDIVVFTIRDGDLAVLLIQRAQKPYADSWALPGGFVRIDEGLDAAAARELSEETGIENVALEQLHAFGEPDRDPRERVITVAYYALIPSSRAQIRAASDAKGVAWFGLGELPSLAFDHARILDLAVSRLRARLAEPALAAFSNTR
jgi:8-oxo-dGTP diphosphatase